MISSRQYTCRGIGKTSKRVISTVSDKAHNWVILKADVSSLAVSRATLPGDTKLSERVGWSFRWVPQPKLVQS